MQKLWQNGDSPHEPAAAGSQGDVSHKLKLVQVTIL